MREELDIKIEKNVQLTVIIIMHNIILIIRTVNNSLYWMTR